MYLLFYNTVPDKMGIHKLSSNTAQYFIVSIFNKRQFSSIEDHADTFIVEVVLLISSRTLPRNLKWAMSWDYGTFRL